MASEEVSEVEVEEEEETEEDFNKILKGNYQLLALV